MRNVTKATENVINENKFSAALFHFPSSLKMQTVFYCRRRRRRCRTFEISYYVTVLYTQNGRRLTGCLPYLNKRHQKVESPSHVHRSSVN